MEAAGTAGKDARILLRPVPPSSPSSFSASPPADSQPHCRDPPIECLVAAAPHKRRLLKMPNHAVVVIGASAGGLDALTTIVERLPSSLPACVLVVMHASSNGVLPSILNRVSSLPVAFAKQGGSIKAGGVYVAPSDFHLLVGARGVMLVRGPRENGFRPAIDPLFRTAARELGSRVIGVVLSGALSDGTYGLSAIKQHGGFAIVQDPKDAAIPSMPHSAITHVEVDKVLAATEIAREIERGARRIAHRKGGTKMGRTKELEPQDPSQDTEIREMDALFGPPSGLTCPDCGGALWHIEDGQVVRYQCHTGHQYAPENLEAAQRDGIDGALWTAVRVLEEHANLKSRMAKRAAEGGMKTVSEGFTEGARDAHEQARRIRLVLFSLGNGNRSTEEARSQTRSRSTRAAGKKRAPKSKSRRQRAAKR